MKRVIIYVSVLLCVVLCLSGCGSTEQESDSKKTRIVCTVFPEYDWMRELTAGVENTELTLISKNGTDIHSYQATANDLVKIASCDLLVYVGGTSDIWIQDALSAYDNSGRTAVSLLDMLGDNVKNEELKEGMEEESDHDEGEHEHEEKDEHVWLSIKNAEIICKKLTEKLCEIDSENAEAYTKNCEAYIDSLERLDGEYEAAVSAGRTGAVLFAGRFPFRYLIDDYGLDYYAAFPGCSSETEASFSTVIFLAEKCDALGLKYIVTTDGMEDKIAEAIIQNTDAKPQVIAMDPMQSVTADELKNGKTYISVMNQNLDVLKKALS